MKFVQLFTTILLSILTQTVAAQNVGIDEPNPSEKLDVNGRIVAKGFKHTVYEAGGIDASLVNLPYAGPTTWLDLPDLTIDFTLEAATTVMSSYTFSSRICCGSNQFVATRLVIDGGVVTRIISSGDFIGNNDQFVSELAAGDHTIKVQYRASTSLQNNPAGTGLENRFLQVLVFGAN